MTKNPILVSQLEDAIAKAKADGYKSSYLDEKRDLLIKLAQPGTKINLAAKEDYSKVGNSRIGGFPDLPDYSYYPRFWTTSISGPLITATQHFTFLAQLNLAELPQPSSKLLPKTGMLYFFYVDEEEVGHKLNTDDLTSPTDFFGLGLGEAHCVLYWNSNTNQLKHIEPDIKERARVFSDQKDEHGNGVFLPYKLSFEPALTLSSSLPSMSLSEKEQEELENLIDELVIELNDSTPKASRFLLRPTPYTQHPEVKAYLFSQGKKQIYLSKQERDLQNEVKWFNEQIAKSKALGHSTQHLENKKETLLWYQTDKAKHDINISKWCCLLELNSHYPVGMSWGDNGFLQFMIHEDDLINRDFSKTFVTTWSS